MEHGSSSYSRPPLVEVAMSIQFDPPQGVNQAHLGAYWATQRDVWPNVRSAQSISPSAEEFGTDSQWFPPALRLALTNLPEIRLQMTSADNQWMQQIQLDRLVVNWRKRSPEYPRFPATWHRFRESWISWNTFLRDYEIAPPIPRIWELTYVNRVPKGQLWASPADWPLIFPGLWGGNVASINEAELSGLHGQWVWEFPGQRTRLFVEAKPARTKEPTVENVLILTLTARGSLVTSGSSGNNIESLSIEPTCQAIESGHLVIVQMFDRIASDRAKLEWGQNAGNS